MNLFCLDHFGHFNRMLAFCSAARVESCRGRALLNWESNEHVAPVVSFSLAGPLPAQT